MNDEQMCEAVVDGLRGFEVGDIVSDRHLSLRGGRVTQVDEDGSVNVYYDHYGGDGDHSIVGYTRATALKYLQHD